MFNRNRRRLASIRDHSAPIHRLASRVAEHV